MKYRGRAGKTKCHFVSRCYPYHFWSVVEDLSDSRKEEIYDIGFGFLVQWKIGGIDSKVVMFLADQFDHTAKTIQLHDKVDSIGRKDV